MPRIPSYESRVAPGTGTGIALPRAGAEMFGAGLGDAMVRTGQMLERRAAEKTAAAENAGLTRAGLDFSRLSGDMDELVQQARQNATADGAGHQQALLDEFDKRANPLLEQAATPKAREWLQLNLQRARDAIRVKEGGYAAGLAAEKVVADHDQSAQIDANNLFTKPERDKLDETIARNDALVDALAIPAAAKEKLKSQNRDRFATSYAQGLAERDPYALRREIESGTLNGVLPPETMASLHNRADSEIRAAEAAQRTEAAAARAAAAAARREQVESARAFVGGIHAALDAGVPVPAAEVRRAVGMAAAVGDPGRARAVAALGTRAAVNQQYAGLPPMELQQAEQALSTRITRAGANANPLDIVARDQLASLRAAQGRATSTDLLGWVARQGTPIPPLDPANPQSFAERGRIAAAAARKYGVPSQPLTSTEADTITARLTSGTPKERMQAAELLGMFGPQAMAAARQVMAKDPLAGWAAGMTAQGRRVGVMDLFAGHDALKANPRLAPADMVDARFAATTGDALRFMPEVAPVAKQAAALIGATRTLRGGGSDWNPKAYDAALSMAFGGMTDAHGAVRGGMGEWNGGKVVLPNGMTQDEFDAGIRATDDARLKGRGDLRPVGQRGEDIPAASIRAGRLYSAGEGRYYVILRGAQTPLRNARGGVFTLAVGTAAAGGQP